jgi:ribosome-binding ATPase
MAIQAGIVGLPNVGKSTLFNALTKSSIPAENYPFCTIEPNTAITNVPDKRTEKLKQIYNSQKTVPATVTFVDIAGLVKGASEGEGLGNKFLSHIREVDLIIHVLRCFENDNIHHQESQIDPIKDFETILTELMLKDIESVQNRLEKLENLLKSARHNSPQQVKQMEEEQVLLKNILDALGNLDHKKVHNLLEKGKGTEAFLLSEKKFIVVANVSEIELENHEYESNQHYKKLIDKFGKDFVIPLCVKTEHELSQMPEEEVDEMMQMLNIKQRSIDTVIQKTYQNLGLISFFTCGPKEIHEWSVIKGKNIRQAAGEIHSDMERGFICAEVFNDTDLFEHGSEQKLRDIGKIRTEGQDYIVQDGDIVFIKFNV